jgi:hypothetical protein
MTHQSFVAEAANSETGMSAAAGLWSGLPVIATYVPHEENSIKPLAENEPRFQFQDGYTSSGAYVGSGYEIEEKEEYAPLSIHDNMIIIFSRALTSAAYPGGSWSTTTSPLTTGTLAGPTRAVTNCSASATPAAMTRQ